MSRLNALADVVEPVVAQARESMGDESADDLPFVLHDLEEAGRFKGLIAELRAVEGIDIFDGTMRATGRSASGQSVDALARWLIERAFTTSVSSAVGELERYLAEDSYSLSVTTALGGVDVRQDVELQPDLLLCPYSEEQFLEEDGPQIDGWARGTRSITAALVSVVRFPKIHYKKEEGGKIPSASSNHHDEVMRRHDDTRLLIGLLAPSSPSKIGERTDLDPSVPLGHIGGGASWQVFSDFSDTVYLSPDRINAIRELHSCFVAMPEKARSALRVPMTRLQRAAAGRHELADAAVDLGIALEALFLTDSEQSELSYRLRYRAAKYLSGDMTERRAILKEVNVLYALRSRAVHRGTVDDTFKGRPTKTLIRDGTRLAAQAVRRIILDGKLPDWDELLLT